MTFKRAAAVAALLVLGGCIERPPVYVDPVPDDVMQQSRDQPVRWTYFGDIRTMLQYYPRQAWYGQEDGNVYATCAWNGQGRITDCQVLREAPVGFGFGEATVQMLRAVGQVQAKDPSKPLEPGRGLVINIQWHARG
ncbi:MAG TPA: hypothetical protein VG839_04895 [Asticcacaulis sp.]|nr:hypothetical protein [Asticcacaulis sp.]